MTIFSSWVLCIKMQPAPRLFDLKYNNCRRTSPNIQSVQPGVFQFSCLESVVTFYVKN
jgi:hypothetical protein